MFYNNIQRSKKGTSSPHKADLYPANMELSLTGFTYIDRDKKDSIVLIPGWATDYRIFDSLDLRFNYLIPIDFYPLNFERSLLEALEKNDIKRISLFGWSLGGFVAAEFASRHRELIVELILISIRKAYKKEELAEIKKYLKKNQKGYLYKFYTECFSKKEEMSWFKEKLLKDYCEGFDLNYLFNTLDYLQGAEIKPESLEGIEKIKIIHGECDRIAPIYEAIDIKNSLKQAEFISIENTGHIPFLKEDFNKKI